MNRLRHLDYGATPPHPVPPQAEWPAYILPPFQDHVAYLDARLAECKMRILYNGWQLTQAPLSGFNMHIDEQSLLFGTIDSHGPAAWEMTPAEGNHLGQQLRWITHENRVRAQAARELGISLPLESLRDAFSLSFFEEQVLLFALAFAIHPSFQKLQVIFHPRAHSHDIMGPSVRIATRLLTTSPNELLEAFGYFGPTATLREKRLIVCQPPQSWNTRAPLEQHIFFLEPGVLLALLGQAKQRQDAIVSWPKDAFDVDVAEVPTDVGDELRDILARFLAEKGFGEISKASNATDDSVGAPSTAVVEAVPAKDVGVLQESLFDGGLWCLLTPSVEGESDGERPGRPLVTRWAKSMARATKRSLMHVDLAALWAAEELTESTSWEDALRDALRDAQIQSAAVLLQGLQTGEQARDVRFMRSLYAIISGFSGLLCVDCDVIPNTLLDVVAAQEGAAPVLHLFRDEAGKASLKQLHGEPIRRKAQREGLAGLEAFLCQRVVGQEDALKRLAEVLRVRKAQVDANPRKPDGVFLLAGPSGVGKTETAKALNEALFGSPDALLRLDMSEFHFRESISGLIGTTPGWVGYEKGGRLTNAIQKNPEAIVLLDEIEKAHPQVLDVFLQVFDDGRLTDGKGQTVDMSRATFLMTSNLGAQLFAKEQRLGFVKESSREALAQDLRGSLRKHLRPEFINRIDEVLVYYPLNEDHLTQICHRSLRALQLRFARKGIWLTIDEAIVPFVTSQTTPDEGARSLQRHIEQTLAQPLAATMLASPDITRISLILRDGQIVVEETPT